MKRLLLCISAAAAFAATAGCSTLNHETRTCTVTDKDRTSGHKSGSDMRIYTSCGTLKVHDNIVSGTDSSDLFGKLQPGHTYRLKTGGFRSGWLSQFPTILSADDIGAKP